jgi:hypothetical protein
MVDLISGSPRMLTDLLFSRMVLFTSPLSRERGRDAEAGAHRGHRGHRADIMIRFSVLFSVGEYFRSGSHYI